MLEVRREKARRREEETEQRVRALESTKASDVFVGLWGVQGCSS